MEITDDKLLRIALITSLIGIIGLIAFSPTIEVKEVDIKDINNALKVRNIVFWHCSLLKIQCFLYSKN